jgi:hypothetical protein
MYDSDIVKVVQELIEKDLEKTDRNNIEKNIKQIKKEVDIIEKNRHSLFDTYHKLSEKSCEIYNRVNKKDIDLVKQQKKKDNSKMITEKLPEFMENIRKEVDKCLIVDNLESSK